MKMRNFVNSWKKFDYTIGAFYQWDIMEVKMRIHNFEKEKTKRMILFISLMMLLLINWILTFARFDACEIGSIRF